MSPFSFLVLFLSIATEPADVNIDASQLDELNMEHHYPSKLSMLNEQIYIFAMVADNDHKSKLDDNTFVSYLQHFKLTIKDNGQYDVEFIEAPFSNDYDFSKNDKNYNYIQLQSKYGRKERGMELSELVLIDEHLLSIDDRTGILYEITSKFEMNPISIIKEYESNNLKENGLKVEWATTKSNLIYIGSFGKEYTNTKGNIIQKLTPNYIVTYNISNNQLEYYDWSLNYNKLRLKTGTLYPGYLYHEAIEWSEYHNKWFILPRYISFDYYDADLTEKKGSNLLLIVSEDFQDIDLVWITSNYNVEDKTIVNNEIISILDNVITNKIDIDLPYITLFDLNQTELKEIQMLQNEIKRDLIYSNRGFSSFTFLPGSNDTIIIALKTSENIYYECQVNIEHNECETPTKRIESKSYLTMFNIDGSIVLNDMEIPSDNRYEGVVLL